MKRWAARATEPDFISPHHARMIVNELMRVEEWDEASINKLLNLCERLRMYPPLYHRVKGGDHSVCGQLLGYVGMCF